MRASSGKRSNPYSCICMHMYIERTHTVPYMEGMMGAGLRMCYLHVFFYIYIYIYIYVFIHESKYVAYAIMDTHRHAHCCYLHLFTIMFPHFATMCVYLALFDFTDSGSHGWQTQMWR